MVKYAVIFDEENNKYTLNELKNNLPTNKVVVKGCNSLHDLFMESEKLGISKSVIVDFLKLSEVKQYS